MHDAHDDRRIPIDPQPAPQSVLESIRFWLTFGPLRRNKQDQSVAKAAARNRSHHETEAHRVLTQPGASQDAVDKALRILGRVGRGSA